MKKIITLSLLFISTISFGQVKEVNSSKTSSDIKTVEIGTQKWMSKNLNVANFRNGDVIKEVKTYLEWKKNCKAGKPVWCYYKFNVLNGEKYGKLYNWFAVNDPRGIAPEGFKIPSNTDFETLENAIRINPFSEIKENEYNSPKTIGFQLKSKFGWKEFKGQNGNGNDKFGFNALPGGYVWLCNISTKKGVYLEGIDFVGAGDEIYFWTNNPENSNYHLCNGWFGSEIYGNVPESSQFCCRDDFGFYIRCIKE
jgi:uncharacterized protein (TIGR02145 family)